MKKKVLRERRKPVEVKPVEVKEAKPKGRKKKEDK
jgi:hypothetical protein